MLCGDAGAVKELSLEKILEREFDLTGTAKVKFLETVWLSAYAGSNPVLRKHQKSRYVA